MSNIQFTTVDRMFAKFSRELRGTDINESDVIEWIGEALGFMKMPELQEQAVAFIKVENFEACIPDGFQGVLQLARYHERHDIEVCEKDIELDISCPDCCGTDIVDVVLGRKDYYRPYFDMQWQYIPWTVSKYYKEYFTPIRLANHNLFNSIVFKEKHYSEDCCGEDEYTIEGMVEKVIRTSFKEGVVALSYLKAATDPETGYPLIPDHIQHISAINYYVRWKIAEYLAWNGREGFANLAQENERLWLRYIKQAKNYTKMPKSLDQYQNLLEESHHLIPRHKRYYNFFGKLGRAEDKRYNDPNYRNNRRYYAR